jgi:glycosyltransferase involved in cell wall biosynthesis
LVISEAFARGLPVVATAVGGIPELCRDGAAWLVPAGRPGALSRALGEALDRAALAREHDAHDSVLKVAAAAV